MTMISSTPNFFACPNCNQYYAEPRLMSFNNFGDLYYFDGYRDSTINTLNTEFVQCCDCELVFKRNELMAIDESTIDQKKWDNFNRIKKPKIDFYLGRADKSKHGASEELNERLEAMWEYNHAFRGALSNAETKQAYYLTFKEQITVNENRLLELLGNDDSHIMIKADIYRRRKQFNEAKRLIRLITNDEFRHIRALFSYLCTRKIIEVVDIEYEPDPQIEKFPSMTADQKNFAKENLFFWDDKVYLTFATSSRFSFKEVAVIIGVIIVLSWLVLYLAL